MTVQRHPPRPRAGVTTVGQVAALGGVMLTLACDRCGRRGRLSVARLLAEWGEHAALADIMDELTANCPRRVTHGVYDRCDPRWPDLSALLMGPKTG